MSKQVIGIVGGGLMGHGIAYLFAAAGHQVGVYEPDTDSRASLPQRWRQILDRFKNETRGLTNIVDYDTDDVRRCHRYFKRPTTTPVHV